MFAKKRTLQERHTELAMCQMQLDAHNSELDTRRQEYYTVQLPATLRQLQELGAELGTALKAYLMSSGKCFDELVASDLDTLQPKDG